MVPPILLTPPIQDSEKTLVNPTQEQITTPRLMMQWTLDENSKLICTWVKSPD
ncbi:hypothetical protein [Chroococcus sp. FPU101]|uniref:hypothetical protein n=1 Tax=Chroococcus sp. FPU101 TaxID=1974212 RepID=UPI001A8ED73C|nr:hypothetical protein [Chroococcus sp. FPU101]GFE67927.1 hypothetical protein CFPU101_05370 [Chroococcus sp. FPU101]